MPQPHTGEVSGSVPERAPTDGAGAVPVLRATTALVRRPCAHRWDLSQRTCTACGERVYVEVLIS